jgi:hypothetical protein
VLADQFAEEGLDRRAFVPHAVAERVAFLSTSVRAGASLAGTGSTSKREAAVPTNTSRDAGWPASASRRATRDWTKLPNEKPASTRGSSGPSDSAARAAATAAPEGSPCC